MPNLPVTPGSPRFLLAPKRRMFAKSDSVNGALLNARRAGPACGEKLDPYWYACIKRMSYLAVQLILGR
jgi:hypothetical protein